MSRLIDADELERAAMGLGEDVVCDGCFCEFMDLIDKQPTIEAEPVRHGHWIDGRVKHITNGEIRNMRECSE